MDEKGTAVADAQRLLAEGAPLTLADGRTVHVRFSMRALTRIEQHFGSISQMALDLSRPQGKKFTALVHALAAGLTHEGLDYEQLLDLLHPAKVDEYDQAMEAAWDEAFPPSEASDPNPPGEQGSPGSVGTETPPSTSDVQMASSGV